VLAEAGSAHIESLCKWGPTTFTRRTRLLPSGRPPETLTTLVQDDPTWVLEYDYFKRLVAAGTPTDLATDRWLLATLNRLAGEAIEISAIQ
jgi:scyllo-inositol 2-dehydrogenase (NADP+)